jgi:hypothetical protein
LLVKKNVLASTRGVTPLDILFGVKFRFRAQLSEIEEEKMSARVTIVGDRSRRKSRLQFR